MIYNYRVTKHNCYTFSSDAAVINYGIFQTNKQTATTTTQQPTQQQQQQKQKQQNKRENTIIIWN